MLPTSSKSPFLSVTTKVLVLAGRNLQLNVDTSAGGVVKVEIMDDPSEPIPGFAQPDCDELNGNYIRVPVCWGRKTGVRALAGKTIGLRFVMRDPKLYSFQFLP